MKKLVVITAVLVCIIGFFASAQEQVRKRKPGFSLNDKSMDELGFSAEQKKKINDSKAVYYAEVKKIQAEGADLLVSLDKSIDSVLTPAQIQKVAALRAALKEQYKTNPSQTKPLYFDSKMSDELGLSPEQRQKIVKINANNHTARWQNAQKMGKVINTTNETQMAVFTPEQKQKMEAIKAEIAEYNKTAQ
jgi:hypothetical protein